MSVPPSLWRISNYCDLVGLGGEKADGRWHTAYRNRRIVYLAGSSALALIETLVNLHGDPNLFPDEYQLMKVDPPATISTYEVTPAELGPDWRNNMRATQRIGNEWLLLRETALLVVPSVPSPESTNYLLNPQHPDAKNLMIDWCHWVKYDKRLFHTGKP